MKCDCVAIQDILILVCGIIYLYRNEATFLGFAPFQSILSMAVWNTIDDRYSFFPIIKLIIQSARFFI